MCERFFGALTNWFGGINALEYNIFDPTEVVPEFTADVGTKKGEKVDYAILMDGKPIILFECKCSGTDLDSVYSSQLYRYFSVTEARFAVLTNGIIYRFYSDLDKPNKMDEKSNCGGANHAPQQSCGVFNKNKNFTYFQTRLEQQSCF
ncbi:MAG: type I restriction endonuclease, partial [Methanotrichaceae archaeon]